MLPTSNLSVFIIVTHQYFISIYEHLLACIVSVSVVDTHSTLSVVMLFTSTCSVSMFYLQVLYPYLRLLLTSTLSVSVNVYSHLFYQYLWLLLTVRYQ